jgi:hypothetical protein
LASANETVVRRAIEAIWNGGDLDVADELFAESYINHHGVITDLVRGPEAIKISVALHHLAFPDLHITIEELRTDHDLVVLCWTACGGSTMESESGVPPTNQQLLTGTTRSRLAAGKIIESWTEWRRG